ncbi:hypothetical protein HYPSUDRAFT_340201 [Hypholoma sublateritium FD-334 SS-4]|uniref:Uncharacterized protein n=1 Tax=Hypholoma sublateritium (strain FD-334 SS-4) TaxID=945553 RepID=A0A0D2P4U2_HYPSF|nr:hypothetical protein HYPSUDRAFT_340201 [Hypholoma sublateritium FD-334 SS-4]
MEPQPIAIIRDAQRPHHIKVPPSRIYKSLTLAKMPRSSFPFPHNQHPLHSSLPAALSPPLLPPFPFVASSNLHCSLSSLSRTNFRRLRRALVRYNFFLRSPSPKIFRNPLFPSMALSYTSPSICCGHPLECLGFDMSSFVRRFIINTFNQLTVVVTSCSSTCMPPDLRTFVCLVITPRRDCSQEGLPIPIDAITALVHPSSSVCIGARVPESGLDSGTLGSDSGTLCLKYQ